MKIKVLLLPVVRPLLKFLLGLAIVDELLDNLDKKADKTETDIDDFFVGKLRDIKDELRKVL
jgi:hypothetical protein